MGWVINNSDWPSGDGEHLVWSDDDDVRESDSDEEVCVFCNERRGAHEFEDGLRCVYCAEAQDAPRDEA